MPQKRTAGDAHSKSPGSQYGFPAGLFRSEQRMIIQPVSLADETGCKQGTGMIVQFLGCPHLFHLSILKYGNGIADAHGLLLVVGHEHRRNAQLRHQAPQLLAHLHAQQSIQSR